MTDRAVERKEWTDEEALAVLDEMVNKIVVDPSDCQDEFRAVPRAALAHLRARLKPIEVSLDNVDKWADEFFVADTSGHMTTPDTIIAMLRSLGVTVRERP